MNITYTSSSPTATPTPVPTAIPDENVDLSVPCDAAFRLNNSNWQDDAGVILETADDLLYSNFKIDFYNKSYISWTSPADICGDAPFLCTECSCPTDCPNCTCSTPGHCSEECYCPYHTECKYRHNMYLTMHSSAMNQLGSMDIVTAFTKNCMYEITAYIDPPEKKPVYGYGDYTAAIYRSENPYQTVPDWVCILHEVCHLYGAEHCGNTCIMSYYEDPNGNIYFRSTTGWCSQCASTIMANRTRFG